MNKVVLGIMMSALVAVGSVQAEKYELDHVHGSVGFSVRHMGLSNVKGTFDTCAGSIEYDGKDLSTFKLNLTIDVDSINTKNKKRDDHLLNEDFFDA